MASLLQRLFGNKTDRNSSAVSPKASTSSPDLPTTNPGLDAMRRSYQAGQLIESQTPVDDPFPLFRDWLSQAMETARQHRWAEANAMTLATVSASGTPAARVVLLKGIDHGLIFYTNYQSAKGQDLNENPVACLNFFWPWLEQQVRFTGPIEQLPRETSETYFRSRPRGSQLGALVSDQSQPISNRDALDQKLEQLDASHPKDNPEKPIPFPDNWGGYRLIPTAVEFWQGRDNRLHDRLRYTRESIDAASFSRVRLQP